MRIHAKQPSGKSEKTAWVQNINNSGSHIAPEFSRISVYGNDTLKRGIFEELFQAQEMKRA
jgi:hypothetical protein